MSRLACIALALATAAACGKGDSKGGGAKGGGDIPADHVAAVNAALPADLKGKIEFEAGRVVENEKKNRVFKAAIPKGWKKGGVFPGQIVPADADDKFGDSPTLGKTNMSLDRSCGGECVKKDWAAIVEKDVTNLKGAESKVLKDEKRPNGRTFVVESKPSMFPEKDVAIYVYTAWWQPEDSEYYTCRAQLGTPVKGAADAFEKACSKVFKE